MVLLQNDILLTPA